MGGTKTTEIIIEYAPVALNLLGKLTTWLLELDVSVASTDKSFHAGCRTTMRKGQIITLADNPSDDMEALGNTLSGAIRQAFLEQYLYSYNGAASFPRNAQMQDGKPVMLVPGEDFTNCAANNAGSIGAYVTTNIITDNLPSWAEGQLTNDLVGSLSTLLSGPQTNAWISKPLPKTITGGASGATLKADISLLYCVTDAPDPKNPGQNVKTLFCKYIGVYYLGQGWPGLTVHDIDVPGTAQLLAVDCAVGDAALATALGVQIVRTQPASANTIFRVSSGKFHVGVAIKYATAADDTDEGSQQLADAMPIPLEWFVEILKDHKVEYTTQLRNATPSEYKELEYLDKWEREAAFKRGDFTSLQY
ncbi:hypothetical protein C8R45DRAFT_938155 [Mycena sanguinolenta]|nr:hypothetical protein C8R45DRAFT_938155 [Mycena sanguinolenta]